MGLEGLWPVSLGPGLGYGDLTGLSLRLSGMLYLGARGRRCLRVEDRELEPL